MIQMTTEEKAEYIQRIQRFFANERDEEIGIVAATVMLEFFMEEIGVTVYNKGVDQAKAFMQNKLEDALYDVDEIKQ